MWVSYIHSFKSCFIFPLKKRGKLTGKKKKTNKHASSIGLTGVSSTPRCVLCDAQAKYSSVWSRSHRHLSTHRYHCAKAAADSWALNFQTMSSLTEKMCLCKCQLRSVLGNIFSLATKQADYTGHGAENAAGKKKIWTKRLSCEIWQGIVRGFLYSFIDLAGESVKL